VYEQPAVHVIADVPLIRAGLMRAATRAGMRAVSADEAADVTLHSPGDSADPTPVDVCAGLGRVTLTVQAPTSPLVWPALQTLVAQLLGDETDP
jgi:hypothetical protein